MMHKTRSFGGVLVIWVVAIIAMAGCDTVHDIKRTGQKLGRGISFSGDDLYKQVLITPFVNRTFTTAQQIETIFEDDFINTFKRECPRTNTITPKDPAYPQSLRSLPRLSSGQVDTLKLAQEGQALGINYVVTGGLVDISAQSQEKGFFWFKGTHNMVRIRIELSVYSTETGAKIMDESSHHEIEVDGTDPESLVAQSDQAVVLLETALRELAIPGSEKACDAVSAQPWKGYVTAVSGKRVTLSAGTNAGLETDQLLDVHANHDIFEGSGGQHFFLPGLKTGQVKIVAVHADRAEAVLLSGEAVANGSSLRSAD